MIPVKSSNLKSIGYDNGILYVEFRDGSLYEYYDVPRSEYNGLATANSHGHYHAVNIKGKYRYKRIR